jgi:formate hydrogenlyase subunit 3/multisubunit Na+/H+ antiporter MnhD subunit
MSLLLVGLGLLIASGILALLTGRTARVSTVVGVAGAVVGCGLGLVPVINALAHGTTESVRRTWDVPYGSFSLELDPLSAFFLVPILSLSALAAIYGGRYLLEYRERKGLGAAWFFYNLLVASMVMVVLARNGVLFLVAWELMSLASYFLVTFDDEKPEVREAGRTYLIATHLGTAFLLAFFVLLGGNGSSLDFVALAASGVSPNLANVLFVLALIGFGTKAGFMPFHVWLPEAHPAAPSHVSAVMSGVMVKTGIYGLVRTLSLLPQPPTWWGWLLIVVGALSGVWGILFAIAQHDLKRLLAYSTVENVGIIALGLGAGLVGLSSQRPVLAVLGFSGAILHVLNHALFKGLLFLSAGAVLHATGTRQIDRLGGLSKRMPVLAIAVLVGVVAICGLPPLNGFIGEFLIYLAAFRGERVLGTASAVTNLGVIASLALIGGLAAVCFAKVYGVVFLGSPRTGEAAHAHAPDMLLTGPIIVLAAGCVTVGLFAPRVVASMEPVVAIATRLDTQVVGPAVADAVALLVPIVWAAFTLIVLVLALALLRRHLLASREVGTSGTWGCGYQGATVRMQYTSSSFVQPALEFFAPFLRTRKKLAPPSGLFPAPVTFATDTPDLPKNVLYVPVFGSVSWAFGRLRWLQHGNVHVYILYLALTIVVLLIWFLGLKH